MQRSIPTILLPWLLVVLVLAAAFPGCNGSDSQDRTGEGEGDAEPQDAGLQDATIDLGPEDLGPPDLGPVDTGIDQWEDRVKKKDGIRVKLRATSNPRLSIIFTRPTETGTSRRLCYWLGTDPEDPGPELACLNLRIGNPSTPIVSSDGYWVTFIEAGGSKILLANLETKETQILLSASAADGFKLRNPTITPGATLVTFQKELQGATHVSLLDRLMEEETPIWEQQGSTGPPDISDDGQSIVFHSDPTGNNEVYRWDSEVQQSVNLSGTSLSHEKDPRISSDARVICFRQAAQSEGRVGQILVAADDHLRDITSGYSLSYLNNHDCQLSNTGRHVVFRSLPGQVLPTRWLQGGYFYVYDLNADSHRQLPNPAGVDKTKPHSPWRLSSDGRWIVFTAVAVGSDSPDLWLLDVRAGHTIRLVDSPEAEGTGAPGVN